RCKNEDRNLETPLQRREAAQLAVRIDADRVLKPLPRTGTIGGWKRGAGQGRRRLQRKIHRSVWAVGGTGNATIILVWNGHAWSRVASGPPGVLNGLWGTSAKDAWAVGLEVLGSTY